MTIQPPEWSAPLAVPPSPPSMPAGWYPDGQGNNRYWDGQQWTQHLAAAPPTVPVQPNVRQSADRAQYIRQQKGHSLILNVLFGWVLLYIPTIYYAVSPNHYFHA